jgi:hypothetical protein
VLEDDILNRAEHVFKMKTRAPNGDIKEFTYIPGGMYDFPSKCICICICICIACPSGILLKLLFAIYRTNFARCETQHKRGVL